MRPAYGTALLVTFGLCSPARADEFSGTRTTGLVERAHDIVVTMHRSHAELVVRRTVFNGARQSDQAEFFVDLPEGAVATGLRTRAGSRWFSGELLEAESAAAKYKELTGIGGYYPKDPALLSWRSQQLLALQVFPCPPMAEKTVEYTLTIPTTYEKGAFHVVLPRLGTEALAARVIVARPDKHDGLLVNGRAVASDPGVPFIAPGDEETDAAEVRADVAVVPHDAPNIDGELANVAIGPKRFLTEYAFRAAASLGETPKGAYVAIVVDGSRSTPDEFGTAARAAILAYLSHFADAKVELLTFDRKTTRRYGSFVGVERARRDLVGWQPPRANGSDVDTALSDASSALASAPRHAPLRIVLVTDGLTRQSLTPERLRAAIAGSRAVVHIGVLSPGDAELRRSDDHPWALAVRPSGGLVWDASAGYGEAEKARSVYEEWAHPMRLDRVRLYSPDLALESDEESPSVVDQGEGYRRSFIAEKAVSWFRVEGELWSRPADATFVADASRQKLLAAEVFGSPLLYELTEEEMMPLAMLGGAVSPVTSYLAIEPGVRPSTDGLDEGAGQGIGVGYGRLGGMGGTAVSGVTPKIDRLRYLADALQEARKRCGGVAGSSTVTLETTRAEVVRADASRGGDPIAERCLAEAAWALALPPAFTDEWTTWSVEA